MSETLRYNQVQHENFTIGQWQQVISVHNKSKAILSVFCLKTQNPLLKVDKVNH